MPDLQAHPVSKPSGSIIGGMAAMGPAPTMRQPPLAWVAAGIQQVHPLLRLSLAESFVQLFVHEVAHLFGCDHDREKVGGGGINETNYGFVVEDKYRTPMVYSTPDEDWIPYFSSKDIKLDGTPIGEAQNDNPLRL